jgi:hypothetical protein
MMKVRTVKHWLSTLSDEDEIGIDDGGLCLCLVSATADAPQLEVGGLPDEVCDECHAAITYEEQGDTGADQHDESCSMYEPSASSVAGAEAIIRDLASQDADPTAIGRAATTVAALDKWYAAGIEAGDRNICRAIDLLGRTRAAAIYDAINPPKENQ